MKSSILGLSIGIVGFMPFGNYLLASEHAKAPSQTLVKTGISEEEARYIGMKLVPGRVREVERERHKGEQAYSVEIHAANGFSHEVLINAATGTVIEDKIKESDQDTDRDEGEKNR